MENIHLKYFLGAKDVIQQWSTYIVWVKFPTLKMNKIKYFNNY